MGHCSGCGTQNPQVEDGYTECCNEWVCDGRQADRWVTGTMGTKADNWTRTETGELTACCAAMADRLAAERVAGESALCRKH
jgi:hypothetical protein